MSEHDSSKRPDPIEDSSKPAVGSGDPRDDPEAVAGEARSTWQMFLSRFRKQRPAVIALIVLLIVTSLAILAPWIAPYEPSLTNTGRRLEGPSTDFWLGTDDLGRDMLSRHLFAARVSLLAAVIAVGIALSLSLPLGMLSGFLGGKTDSIIQRFNDGLMSFPGLILAISIIGILGPGLRNAMIAVGLSYVPYFIRIIRAATLAVRQEVYIQAAEQIGSPMGRTLVSHVVPNILSPVIVQTTLALGLAILSEAALSFLGLGAQPPTASWGGMLARSFGFMFSSKLNVITPGLAIMIVVLCFNVLGDGIRDAVGKESRRGE